MHWNNVLINYYFYRLDETTTLTFLFGVRTWQNDYPINGLMLYSNGRYVFRIGNTDAKYDHIIGIVGIPNIAIYVVLKKSLVKKNQIIYLTPIRNC